MRSQGEECFFVGEIKRVKCHHHHFQREREGIELVLVEESNIISVGKQQEKRERVSFSVSEIEAKVRWMHSFLSDYICILFSDRSERESNNDTVIIIIMKHQVAPAANDPW